MLLLGREEVRELLDLDALIDALGPAMADVSTGRASTPGRVGAMVPERESFLGAMPAYLPSAGVLASKLVTLFPGNAGTAVPTHQAVIVVFDPVDGSPVALLDGEEITAARTGAGSALSARLLARPDAAVLAVLGTGVQARSHARAVVRVRPIRELRVAGRDRAKAEALAAELEASLPVGVRVAASFEEALDGAELACATTHAAEPVVRREWLSPGVHVCSVGYNQAGREVDDATVGDAVVCVESRAAALAPPPGGSNDLTEPLRAGLIDESDIVEVGELVAGTRAGRTAPDQITLYKSVGVAAQDAVAAGLVLAAARERGIGREIEL